MPAHDYEKDHDKGHDHSHHEEHDHDHGHDHDESGGGGHDHSHKGHAHVNPADVSGRAFAIAIGLNLSFVIIEAIYGVLTHSMALVAEAGHNLSDVLSLGLSWGAMVLAKRTPTHRRTYGFRGTTILASLANALVLLFVVGAIAWESVRRFAEPTPVAGKTVMIVAGIGILVNAGSALMFVRGSKKDVNVKSALVHLASDALASIGVVAAGGAMMLTGWTWLDPAVSLVLSIVVLVGTWSLLRQSLDLILAAVPQGIDPAAVRSFLVGLPGVSAVHDLHIWAMGTTETALTAHLVMAWPERAPKFLGSLSRELKERFEIHHATVQIEPSEAAADCEQAPDNAV